MAVAVLLKVVMAADEMVLVWDIAAYGVNFVCYNRLAQGSKAAHKLLWGLSFSLSCLRVGVMRGL